MYCSTGADGIPLWSDFGLGPAPSTSSVPGPKISHRKWPLAAVEICLVRFPYQHYRCLPMTFTLPVHPSKVSSSAPARVKNEVDFWLRLIYVECAFGSVIDMMGLALELAGQAVPSPCPFVTDLLPMCRLLWA